MAKVEMVCDRVWFLKADVLSCLHEVKLWNCEIRVILLLKPDLGPDLSIGFGRWKTQLKFRLLLMTFIIGLPVFTTNVEEDYGGVWIPLTM